MRKSIKVEEEHNNIGQKMFVLEILFVFLHGKRKQQTNIE
jgi:hypothetical protein